ncbi:MAG: ATP-binding protein [Thermoleophilaceae bacterium]|nr:ATP-binding protein [Thermoleophilaceae bacterium]
MTFVHGTANGAATAAAAQIDGRNVVGAVRLVLERRPEAVSAARSAVASLAPHVSDAQLEDIRLLVSELVTNSVRHGRRGTNLVVEVEVADDRIHAAVTDGGSGFRATARAQDADLGSGWGLYLVDKISDRWGVDDHGATRVWFEIDRS